MSRSARSSNRSVSPRNCTAADSWSPETTTGCHRRRSRRRRSNGSRRSTKRPVGRFCRRSSKAPDAGIGSSLLTTHTRATRRSRIGTPPIDRAGTTGSHSYTHARDHGPNGHQFHVGVDAHGYTPVPFTEIDAWIRGLPDAEPWLDIAIREARQTITDLDGSETSNSDALFYTMGYNELRVALEELLGAFDSAHPDSPPGTV